MYELKLIVILMHYCFAEFVQIMFKWDNIQYISLIPNKELNNSVYGKPFCVIICIL